MEGTKTLFTSPMLLTFVSDTDEKVFSHPFFNLLHCFLLRTHRKLKFRSFFALHLHQPCLKKEKWNLLCWLDNVKFCKE